MSEESEILAERPALLENEIWAYDESGNKLVPTAVKPGDVIDWKRNGVRGSYRAEIVELKGPKMKIRLLRYSGTPHPIADEKGRWVRRSALRVIERKDHARHDGP